MVYQAQVVHVFIASPSDVAEEREALRQMILEFNDEHAADTKVVLLPRMWEKNSTPHVGAPPQAILDDQIVDSSDIVIAVFWTRIGQMLDDGKHATVHELDRFVDAGKPALLYFSRRPVAPDNLDAEQYQAVKDFKQQIGSRALYHEYSDISELLGRARRDLLTTVRTRFNLPVAIDPPNRVQPLELQITLHGDGYRIIDGTRIRDALLTAHEETERANAEERRRARTTRSDALVPQFLLRESPTPPPSAEEVEAAIAKRRAHLDHEWFRVEEYILGLICPALHFTIENKTGSFLHDVRVVITFTGVHGAAKGTIDDLEHERLLDPDYERAHTAFGPPSLTAFKPKGYPIQWKNRDTGLEVRITLPDLASGETFAWSSEDYDDVVLAALSADPIHATWLAVTREHGEPVAGPEITIPVIDIPAQEVAQNLFRSRSESR